ncbi:MAG TPA: TetR family transcriptional regulator [Flavipsychrobacter sp.]|nr:TetR family transcriptional regulator [Flavipsychrobacter sp.]
MESTFSDKQKIILDVAQQLFADQGFAGTSVRDIAREADVNIAMISYYFGSKEKLLEAIFKRHAEVVRLRLESIIHNAALSPVQKVEHLVDHYIEKYFSKQNFHRLIMREQLSTKESPIASMLAEMKTQNMNLIKQLIAEGQKKGNFRKNIDIPLMMATMLGTTNQLMTTQAFYRQVNNLQSMSDEDFLKHLRKKLSHHLKSLFKAILTHEAQNTK